MKLKLFCSAVVALIFSSFVSGQSTVQDNHGHPSNELGIGSSPLYIVKEKVIAYGAHLHFVHKIHNSPFGIGLGYERIFDPHKHNTFGLIFSYSPVEKLSFSLSPGLTSEDKVSDKAFAMHFETSYEFELYIFHTGPVFEVAMSKEDIHFSLGLHLAICF